MKTHLFQPWQTVRGRIEETPREQWQFVTNLGKGFARGRKSRLVGRSKNPMLKLADRPRVLVTLDWLDKSVPVVVLSALMNFIAETKDVVFILHSHAGIRQFRARMRAVDAFDHLFPRAGTSLVRQWLAEKHPENVEVNLRNVRLSNGGKA